MKIFYKKDFQRVLEEYNKLADEYLNTEIKLYAEIEKIKTNLKSANDKKDKVAAENNKLKNAVKELKQQIKQLNKTIEELKSDRYLVRKVRSTKVPTQTMKVRYSGVKSRAVKKMHDEVE